MFIHSRSSLENPTRFQIKMDKKYTRFQTKTEQKPYAMGRHLPVWLIYLHGLYKGVPPGAQIHSVSLSTERESCVWIIYPRYFRFQTSVASVCKTSAPSNM